MKSNPIPNTILFIVLLFSSIVMNAQSYEKNFSKSGINRFMTVDILDDSTIIVCGQTDMSGNDEALISLLKSDGTVISHNVFGRIGRDYIFDAVIDVGKGNLIIAGNTMENANSADNFFAGVYDINSNTIQMQNYAGNPTADDQLRAVTYTSDNYILAVGEISQSNDAAIVKMDTLGNIIWQKVHNYGGNSVKDQFRDIVEIPGQGYMISGFTENFSSGNYQTTLTKTDNNGTQLWSKVYTDGSVGTYSAQPLVHTSDGGFMVSSVIQNGNHTDVLIIKIDSQGAVQWAKRYGGTANESLLFLKEAANNEFIFGGKTLSYGQGVDAYMTKIDNQGNIIWSEAFGTVGVEEEFWDGEQYINGTDTGFYAVGQARYNNSTIHAYLVKVTNSGNGLDCHSTNAPFTVQNRTITTTNGGSFSNWTGTLPYNMTQTTTTFNESGRTCLYIDLDDDNSSGATVADFHFGSVCYPSFVLVADIDAYIDNSAPIDSVQIFISNGIINTGNEILTITNNQGLTVQGNNSNTLTLSRNGNNSTTDFEDALKNIRYQNTATYITAGVRVISVIAYSGNVASNTGKCIFKILETDIFLNLGNDTMICPNETLLLETPTSTANTYLWQDGSTGSTFNVNQPGVYFVTVSNYCETESDTIEVQFIPTQLAVNLGIDTVLCVGQTITLDATNLTADGYLWQDGSTNPTLTVSQTGVYFVAVSDSCVTIMDTINVIITGIFPTIDLGNDTVLCQGDTLILDAFSPIANTYLWDNGSTNSTLTLDNGGEYIVTATNNCGATNDTINIELLISELELSLGNDTTLCTGDELLLNAFSPAALSYQWQDGSTNSTFNVTEVGVYEVTLFDFCTTISDSIYVEYNTLSVDLGNDTMICEGRTFLLEAAHQNGENYTWHNGSTNTYFGVQTGGQFYVTIDNHCGTVSDTIEVIVNTQTPLVPNLGNDKTLCSGETIILDATTENAEKYIWQDSTEGAVYVVTEPGTYTVTVSNACLTFMDDIEFTADACCNLFVPDAFTPNDDGNNDIFQAYTNCQVGDFSMVIYDRWGGKLFESSDINNGWNGTKSGQTLNMGVYVYLISFNDGFSTRTLEGSVTLIH